MTPLLGPHIGRAILRDLARTRAGDRLVLGMLFLSSHPAVREIVHAQRRGVGGGTPSRPARSPQDAGAALQSAPE